VKGAIVHGVLLVAMLLFGYQTWTREKEVKKTTGEVEMWNEKPGDLTSIVWETPKRTIKLEKRDDYLWGADSKITKKKKPKKKEPEAVSDAGVADAGVGADAGVSDAGVPEPELEEEIVTTTREFPVGPAGDELIQKFSTMRALREIGVLTDDLKEQYGFNDEKTSATLTLVFAGKTRSLIVGKSATGATGKYVADVDSGKLYVVASSTLTPLEGGENALKPKQAVPTGDTVAAIEVSTPAGKSRRIDRISIKDEKTNRVTKTWGDKATGEADATAANWLAKIESDLKPSKFQPELDLATTTELVTLVYRDAKGGELGKLTLYKLVTPPDPLPEGAPPPPKPPEPKVEYFVKSTMTRVAATVPPTAGDQVEQNIATVLP
jgi:hypothetical protein